MLSILGSVPTVSHTHPSILSSSVFALVRPHRVTIFNHLAQFSISHIPFSMLRISIFVLFRYRVSSLLWPLCVSRDPLEFRIYFAEYLFHFTACCLPINCTVHFHSTLRPSLSSQSFHSAQKMYYPLPTYAQNRYLSPLCLRSYPDDLSGRCVLPVTLR